MGAERARFGRGGNGFLGLGSYLVPSSWGWVGVVHVVEEASLYILYICVQLSRKWRHKGQEQHDQQRLGEELGRGEEVVKVAKL